MLHWHIQLAVQVLLDIFDSGYGGEQPSVVKGGHYSIIRGGGAGGFELNKLFILPPPPCNILFISHFASSKIDLYLFHILYTFFYKVGSQSKLSIDVEVKKTSEACFTN